VNPVARKSRAFGFLRLLLAVVVFLFSLLAIIPAPTYLAWELSILATELGYLLAPIALLVLLMSDWKTFGGKLSGILGAAAIALFISPLVRAMPIAQSLPKQLQAAFGNISLRAMPDAPARSSPISPTDLVRGVRFPQVRLDSMIYTLHDGKPLWIDLYRPLKPTSALPIVIMIHGGSWSEGTRHDLPALNRYLASRGYAVAAISYRFAPEYRHPAASEDVRAAIQYLEANGGKLGVDPSRIVLIGRSAGAQLALLAAYTSSDPAIRGVVGLYAPSDQTFGYEHPSNPLVLNSTAVLEAFLGGNPQTAAEAYRTSSPISFVSSRTVPTLLIHGVKDELVWVRQSERLDQRLAAAGVPHLFLRFPWATHGCDYFFRGPCGQISTYGIERFLGSVEAGSGKTENQNGAGR
jgi:acetyl esterase/lipase